MDDIFAWNPSVGGGDYRAVFVWRIVSLAGNKSGFPVGIVHDYDSNKHLIQRCPELLSNVSLLAFFFFFLHD